MFSTLQLVKSSQTPLYLQLANGLAWFIENGQLCPGTKLPSIRSLARELRINRDTVVSAYKSLEQRGLTYGQTGSGTYVSHLPKPVTFDSASLESFSLDNKDLVNFATATLPPDHCPIEVFESISSHLLLEEGWNAFRDSNRTKQLLLLEEVSRYFKQCGLACTPKQVCMAKGLSELLESLSRLNNKPSICIESPCNDISIFRQYGFKVYEVPLLEDGMDLEVLEGYLKDKVIQYIFVTPYLQNPTGVCYSLEKKYRLGTLARQYGSYIIEEDTYSDLLQANDSYVPIYSHATHQQVIYLKNFSQLYLPKLSYSFVILPPNLVSIKPRCPSHDFVDSLFYHYLHHNMWQQSKGFLVDYYRTKYQKLLSLVDIYLTPYMSYRCSLGGLYIWLRLDASYITVKSLCDALLAQHIIVSPGALFYTDQSDAPYIRLSTTRVNMAQMERGIQAMASILHNKKLP